jgi:hypothetical protein
MRAALPGGFFTKGRPQQGGLFKNGHPSSGGLFVSGRIWDWQVNARLFGAPSAAGLPKMQNSRPHF